MLEVVPPSRRAPQSKVIESAGQVSDLIKDLGGVDYVDIPEIVEENYRGVPLYKHFDTRDFCSALKEVVPAECVPNKITVYMGSGAELGSWLRACASKYGIGKVVFVGGINGSRQYNGPSVTESNRIAASIKGLSVGNVCLPSRPGESERMVSKTSSGASFFTTQAIFNPDQTIKLLGEYSAECEKGGLRPSTVFLSFPVATSPYDIDFLQWLGAEIGDDDAARLIKSDNVERASREMCSDALSRITDSIRDDGMGVPIGINIEAVSASNFGAICDMADALRSVSKL